MKQFSGYLHIISTGDQEEADRGSNSLNLFGLDL